jgi:hypothetical protein
MSQLDQEQIQPPDTEAEMTPQADHLTARTPQSQEKRRRFIGSRFPMVRARISPLRGSS